jgi:hypothetical protein
VIMNENIFRRDPPVWSLHAADRVAGPGVIAGRR